MIIPNRRHCLALPGTLIVAIPCANGFVVSADSRTKIRDKFVDGRRKLHVVSTAAPVVVAISGSPDFADPLPPGMAPEAWLPVATYAFRGKDAVASYLAQHPDFVLSLPRLIEAAQALSAGAAAFLARWPNIATNFAGRDLCRLALCQVDPGNQESLYGSVPIVVGPDRKVAFGDPRFLRYRATDDKDLQLIGEGEYVTEHILRDDAAGRQFLPDQVIEMWRTAAKIEDLRSIAAAEVAIAIIRAAETTSAIVPIPSGHGIGGQATTVLVTDKGVALV